MLKANYIYILGILIAIIAGFFTLNFSGSTTGFAIFTEKNGEYFAMTISGDANYAFSFKNLKNETLANVSAKIIFPAGANVSNFEAGSFNVSANSLTWSFESISAGTNTSLTFASDATPTNSEVSATNEAGAKISESTAITAQATTTTIGNATTTTSPEISTTTTTVPSFDYDDEGGAEVYNEKFQKTRDDGKLPKGWSIKKELDLGTADDTDAYQSVVDVDKKKAIKVFGVTTDTERIYSEPIDWSGGNVKLKLSYKSVGNKICEAAATFGFEVLFSDGSGDTTLILVADNLGNVSGGSEQSRDFFVSSKEQKDGWNKISAKSVENIEAGRKLRFFASQPSENCGSGFYISEVSVK